MLPERDGILGLLKKYINLKTVSDWILLFALLAALFIPGVPHPIPIFYGDKGSAKTTAQRILRKLIDPAYRDTMTIPTDKNEMALLLMTNYTPCFDNLDGLQPWQSDLLCQAATGGGISKRELYTDIDEIILSFLRCPMLNGINLVASRDDLLDRSILFQLDRIDEERRMEESVFWQQFEIDRPFILGALFDAISKAMRIHPTFKLNRMPRMADFGRWGYATIEAIGGSGEDFLAAYYINIAGAVEEAIMADQVSAAIVEFMEDREHWAGTATELLDLLKELPNIDTKAKSWPKRPHTLTRRINKLKSALADTGIKAETSKSGAKRGVTLFALRVGKEAYKAHKGGEIGGLQGCAFKDEDMQSVQSAQKSDSYVGRGNGDNCTLYANDAFLATPQGNKKNNEQKEDPNNDLQRGVI